MQPAAMVVVFVATQGPLFHQSDWLGIERHLKIKRALRHVQNLRWAGKVERRHHCFPQMFSGRFKLGRLVSAASLHLTQLLL